MSGPKPGELLLSARRNGKRLAARHAVYGFVNSGDVVTIEAGKSPIRYVVLEKKKIDDLPFLIVRREDGSFDGKTWEIDTIRVRQVFQGIGA